MKSFNEKELLKHLSHNNKEAFDEIYNRYYPKLRSYVLKFVKIPQYAEDIVQDAFLKVWEIRESIDPEKYFSGYLFTITKNLILKFFKLAANNTDVLDEIVINTTPQKFAEENIIEWKELGNEIQKAIQMLPPKRKEVFLLCKEEQMSYDDVSAKLGISRNTIKEHMVMAMKFIKDYLKSRSLYLSQIAFFFLFLR
ncbi:MAG: RNA polymerase sigma-70 factor [Ginsengibacter sp.]|jgi:RNA polymerase sigma-70 factor (ECF subfamily)